MSGIGLMPGILNAQQPISANDKINVGLIGCRNKGFHVLKNFLNSGEVNCLGICDVDSKVLEEKMAELKSGYGINPKAYGDFRKLLEDKEIDAVIIGTPDHWHCLPTVYACEAGKDVYVEKPLANSIAECDVMVTVAKKFDRVIQVGQQQRSGNVWNGVMQYIHAGGIGDIKKVNVWANFRYGLGAKMVQNQLVPEGLNYGFWLGPAPKRPYNPSRVHGSWRHFWDYGGGLMTDWGVHLLDMALWAKNVDYAPGTILASGENYDLGDYSRETYATMKVVYPMKDYMISWCHTAGMEIGPYDMPYGVEFFGDKGGIVADRSDWQIKLGNKEDSEAATLLAKRDFKGHGMNDEDAHVKNFIDCVRSRKTPNCPVEMGSNVAMYAHMGNIAVRSKEFKLEWDEGNTRFTDSALANSYITPAYRKPWVLPDY